MKKRVYQILASSGFVTSKKEAEELARQGKIKVGGEKIFDLNYFIDIKKKTLTCEGKFVKPKKPVYFLFNKPVGLETSKQNILRFLDMDGDLKKTIFPIGRLDKNSEGLMILTNDGGLVGRVLSPESHVEKIYFVAAEKELALADVKKMERGVAISMEENGHIFRYETKPCKVKRTAEKQYEIIITEGKKRQIRRMFESVGNKVVNLRRIAIGKIVLDDLKSGECKQVSGEFVLSNL